MASMTIREKVARALHAQTAKNMGKIPVPSYEHDKAGFYADMSTAAINAFLAATAEKDWHLWPDRATEEVGLTSYRDMCPLTVDDLEGL